MKKSIKKFTSTLCMTILLSVYSILSATGSVSASEIEKDGNTYFKVFDEYDKVLAEAGTPNEILNSFSDVQKKFITRHLDRDAVYESSESYIMDVSKNEDEGIAVASVSNLSKSLLQVTVNNYSMTVNGEKQNAIFPSFKWLANGYSISNDSFAVALYQGWEVVPDTVAQMAVYLKNASGTQQEVIYYPTDASQYGYSYQIPKGAGNSAPGGFYEGNSVFYARKKKTSATNAITVKYVHDATSLHGISYSINIKEASITIDSQEPQLMVYAANISI